MFDLNRYILAEGSTADLYDQEAWFVVCTRRGGRYDLNILLVAILCSPVLASNLPIHLSWSKNITCYLATYMVILLLSCFAWVTGKHFGGIAWVTGGLLVSHCKTTTLREGSSITK